MRAFLKSLLKLSYISVATASVLFGLTLAGALALTYAMGETSCRDDKYNNTRTYLCDPPPLNWSTVYFSERRINSMGVDQRQAADPDFQAA